MSEGALATSVAMPAPPGPLREFWGYFSANHGAVAGLVIIVAVLLTAAFAPYWRPTRPISPTTRSSSNPLRGRRAVHGRTRSGRTQSAATSCRA